MKKNIILAVLITLAILLVILFSIYLRNNNMPEIKSFEECVAAGYPVQESYPRKCSTPEGKLFVEQIELPPELPSFNGLDEYYSSIDYSCQTDSDCEIKDIGNCCGYFPKCINKNAQPDLNFVQQYCRENQLGSICGFPSIDECKCIENKCEGVFEGLS